MLLLSIFVWVFRFPSQENKKIEDETPYELVFLLRALLVCSLVLDCLQCYWVGDKNSWRYMPWGQGFLELHALGSGITWISPVNLGTADSFLGQFLVVLILLLSIFFWVLRFPSQQIKKIEDDTPYELVFLLRALLVSSFVLDCLQCYRVGDKNSWRYMPWGQGFLELHASGSGITWISPVNLANADSVLGQHWFWIKLLQLGKWWVRPETLLIGPLREVL